MTNPENIKAQIEKLTRIVNSVLNRPPLSKHKPTIPNKDIGDTSSLKKSRITQMTLKLQDGDLEQKYVSRFCNWLSNDREALKYYVEINYLSAMLKMYYNNKQSEIIRKTCVSNS